MLSIRKLTKKRIPSRIPFSNIADEILGSDYELSLVWCDDKLSQEINKTYRKKEYIPNVLSFPLDEHTGELFINPDRAALEAPNFNRNEREHLIALFVHGALHLKGFTHGSKMESIEKRLIKKFSSSHVSSDSNGPRYRHGNNPRSGLRVQTRK